jgi:hypothetical protein
MHFEESSNHNHYEFLLEHIFCTSCRDRHYLIGYDRMIFVSSDVLKHVVSPVITLKEGIPWESSDKVNGIVCEIHTMLTHSRSEIHHSARILKYSFHYRFYAKLCN